jgi:hypothetical protein
MGIGAEMRGSLNKSVSTAVALCLQYDLLLPLRVTVLTIFFFWVVVGAAPHTGVPHIPSH